MIPKIRFKGFEKEWEEKRLGDIANIFDGTHQTPNYKDNGVKFLSVENIKTLKTNKYISVEDFNKEFKVYPEYGDVLMTRIGNIGETNVVKTHEKLAYYVSLALFKPKEISSYFLKYNIDSETVQKNIWQKTLHIAFPKKINKGEIGKVKTIIPKLPEQEKIGMLFSNIDKAIELLENKYEITKQYKKSMLQKMFPKKDKLIPEIRFKGFEDEWEKKRLENIFISGGSGGTPKSSIKEYYNGNIPFINISDITSSSGYVFKTAKTITEKGFKSSSAKKYPSGSIALAMYASVGEIGIIKIDYASSQAFYNMVFENDGTRDFVYQYLINFKNKKGWESYIEHGTQRNINAEIVKKFKLYMPSLPEQEKIGNFFKVIDDRIELLYDKINVYKDMKKSLLQKMMI